MRRRLRKQLGIERAIEEEKVKTDIAAEQAKVKAETPELTKRPTKKAGAKNDGGTSTKS